MLSRCLALLVVLTFFMLSNIAGVFAYEVKFYDHEGGPGPKISQKYHGGVEITFSKEEVGEITTKPIRSWGMALANAIAENTPYNKPLTQAVAFADLISSLLEAVEKNRNLEEFSNLDKHITVDGGARINIAWSTTIFSSFRPGWEWIGVTYEGYFYNRTYDPYWTKYVEVSRKFYYNPKTREIRR